MKLDDEAKYASGLTSEEKKAQDCKLLANLSFIYLEEP